MERLQIKWLLWLVSLGLALTIGLSTFFPASISGEPDLPATQVANIVGYIYWQAFPAAAIGIALLRHRLWDIDLIIRRTLAYGVITAILALIYLGGVTFFQQILTSLTGQKSPAAVVLSTLLIAALFTPLRRRVQGAIDRRFYRRKYDAARALEEFSAAARREVELEVLGRRLAAAARESLQPESLSLWLRKKEGIK